MIGEHDIRDARDIRVGGALLESYLERLHM